MWCQLRNWETFPMAKDNFSDPFFLDEAAACAWFHKARWPNGPVCPRYKSEKHCVTKIFGRYRSTSPTCLKDFTVMTGTVMERSHAELTHWAVAFNLAASRVKSFSAHQLHRELGCEYNTAWFMFHRVRQAIRWSNLELPPIGGRPDL